jgi:glutamyl-tRNA(Gln) amidotransferase subunit E
LLVHGEAVRQVRLLDLRQELHRRGFTDRDSLVYEHGDVTGLVSGSRLDTLRQDTWERFLEQDKRRPDFEQGEGPYCVRAVRLPGLAETLSRPCQPDLTFAHEIAGRVRVIATLDQAPVLLHSDAWPDYPGSVDELNSMRKALNCESDDALIIVRGATEDTLTAAREIQLRYADAVEGIPHETRQPLAGGHTDFERILPGPDRMYPDTDSPPQRLTRERVENLQVALPEPPWKREQRYSAVDVPQDTIHFLIRRGGARLVDLVVENGSADLRRACFFIGEELKGLRRAGIAVDQIADDRWSELFQVATDTPVLWEARRTLVEEMANRPDSSVEELAEELALGIEPADWRQTLATAATQETENLEPEARRRFLMGKMMYPLRGRVPATTVADALAATPSPLGTRRLRK